MRHSWGFCLLLVPLLIAVSLQWNSLIALLPLPITTADIVMTASGCTPADFVLGAERVPALRLLNRSAEPMVFTLPVMMKMVTVAPGERTTLELPPYIMGEFDLFCLTEEAHIALGGSTDETMFVCGLESPAIRPYALTSGTLLIEHHDRLERLLNATPSPVAPAPPPRPEA